MANPQPGDLWFWNFRFGMGFIETWMSQWWFLKAPEEDMFPCPSRLLQIKSVLCFGFFFYVLHRHINFFPLVLFTFNPRVWMQGLAHVKQASTQSAELSSQPLLIMKISFDKLGLIWINENGFPYWKVNCLLTLIMLVILIILCQLTGRMILCFGE